MIELIFENYPNVLRRSWLASEVLDRVRAGGLSRREMVEARIFALCLTCDADPHLRWNGLDILSHVGNSQCRHRIRECCRDRDEYVRATAVSALASVGNKRDYVLMRRMRNDRSLMVRRYASVAFYDLAGDSVLEELKVFVEGEEFDEAKWGVYRILADKGDSEAEEWMRLHRE